ncbi:YopX family protein [Spirosoma sp. KNUC1025]|nr:YopX family protein [Spirosoma sp. KNUC1025]
MYAVAYFTTVGIYPYTNAEKQSIAVEPFERKDCMLMQFSGVCDAKGVKIFEGNILYWRHYDERENELFEAWHEVTFGHGCFGTLSKNGDFDPFYVLNLGDVIVGNIFENTSLTRRCRI